MKKLLALQLTILMVCIQVIIVFGQDSVKAKPGITTVGKYTAPKKPFDHKNPPINKLVQNVRYAYYRDKTDVQVAAILYANKASYNHILDRIYNDWDAKKGISRAAFDYGIIKKYGDPFPSARPVIIPPPVKPVLNPPAAKPVNDTVPAATVVKPVIPADKSLAGQYQYLLTKVYYTQQPLIGAFHKSFMDTLNAARAALSSAQGEVIAQGKTIDSLQTAAKASGQTLSDSNTKQNEMSLLGISIDKDTYNLVMWGLVILLGIIAAIVVARSGAAGREAKYRVQLYNELEEEFKAYKVKANEKEKKLARELQTERNKLDDLLGNKD